MSMPVEPRGASIALTVRPGAGDGGFILACIRRPDELRNVRPHVRVCPHAATETRTCRHRRIGFHSALMNTTDWSCGYS
jgi:hypothetical protein